MSNLMSQNGRARKTLADQIDRLDRVLDGLAEGLNEAVAAEVQKAVGRAVRESAQAAIKEVLTDPELAARLRPASPPTAQDDGACQRLRSRCGRAARGLRAAPLGPGPSFSRRPTGRCPPGPAAATGGLVATGDLD